MPLLQVAMNTAMSGGTTVPTRPRTSGVDRLVSGHLYRLRRDGDARPDLWTTSQLRDRLGAVFKVLEVDSMNGAHAKIKWLDGTPSAGEGAPGWYPTAHVTCFCNMLGCIEDVTASGGIETQFELFPEDAK